MNFIHPSQKSGAEFYKSYKGKGKFSMLNLLKYKDIADYSQTEIHQPEVPMSGKEAYKKYMTEAIPCLAKAGSRVLFFGKCGEFLIGPEEEKWDAILLVEHESAESFLKFANDPEYLKIAGHRTAALVDSRLLPIMAILDNFSQ